MKASYQRIHSDLSEIRRLQAARYQHYRAQQPPKPILKITFAPIEDYILRSLYRITSEKSKTLLNKLLNDANYSQKLLANLAVPPHQFDCFVILKDGDAYVPFMMDNLIAVGGHSEIYEAYNLSTSEKVILKIDNHQKIRDSLASSLFLNESNALKLLGRFRGELKLADNSKSFLAQQYFEGQTLESFTAQLSLALNQGTDPLEIFQACESTILDVIEAMAYFHAHYGLHCDIKPKNILIQPNGNVVFIDLDTFTTEKPYHANNLSFYTPLYIAPEVLKDLTFTEKSDFYSLGLSLDPISTVMMQCFMKLQQNPYAVSITEDYQATQSIIDKITSEDQDNRPSVQTILNTIDKLRQNAQQKFTA